LKYNLFPYSSKGIAIIDTLLEEAEKSSLDRIKNFECQLWWCEEQDWRKANKYSLMDKAEKDNPKLLKKKYKGRMMISFRYMQETWYMNYLEHILGRHICCKKLKLSFDLLFEGLGGPTRIFFFGSCFYGSLLPPVLF